MPHTQVGFCSLPYLSCRVSSAVSATRKWLSGHDEWQSTSCTGRSICLIPVTCTKQRQRQLHQLKLSRLHSREKPRCFCLHGIWEKASSVFIPRLHGRASLDIGHSSWVLAPRHQPCASKRLVDAHPSPPSDVSCSSHALSTVPRS